MKIWGTTGQLVPSKLMQQILLETMLKHVENKEGSGGSPRGFTEGK